MEPDKLKKLQNVSYKSMNDLLNDMLTPTYTDDSINLNYGRTDSTISDDYMSSRIKGLEERVQQEIERANAERNRALDDAIKSLEKSMEEIENEISKAADLDMNSTDDSTMMGPWRLMLEGQKMSVYDSIKRLKELKSTHGSYGYGDFFSSPSPSYSTFDGSMTFTTNVGNIPQGTVIGGVNNTAMPSHTHINTTGISTSNGKK
jgi:hypothetical protein